MIDPEAVIPLLPEWAKAAAALALFAVSTGLTALGVWQGKRKRDREEKKDDDDREGHDLIGPGPVKDLVTAFGSMADSLSRIVELLDEAAETRKMDERIRLMRADVQSAPR